MASWLHRSRVRSEGSSRLGSSFKKLVSEVSFYYANVTGLRSKTSQLFSASSSSNFDVICLTETWLCGGISDAELFGPGFRVFRRDRHSDLCAPVGGGVLCAVRADIPCSAMRVAGSDDLELLCVILKFPQRSLYVFTAYIPPGSSSGVFDLLAESIDSLSNALLPSDEAVVFGDFNLPAVGWIQSSETEGLEPSFSGVPQHVLSFLDTCASAGFSQCSDVVNGSGRYLDLVFSTNPGSSLVGRCLTPLVPESSHHPALQVLLCFDAADSFSRSLGGCTFNFKKADFSSLNDWLLGCDWADVLSERDIDQAVLTFYNVLYTCFTQCVPVSFSGSPRSSQPWMDDSLRHLKNLKSKAWRRFCSSRSDEDYLAYYDLYLRFSSDLQTSYNRFLSNTRSMLHTNPRQFWRFINSKRHSDGYPSSLRLGGFESNDPHMVANLFADFFRSAFCDSNCDTVFTDFTHLTRLPHTSLEPKDLVFDEVTVTEYLSNLSDGFSCGPDGIPASFLKRCCSSIAPVLCYLFNLSLCCGRFPCLWKDSVIIPLHKKGDKSDISNYRPIANLCHAAKVFEALIADVLRFHCRSFMGPFQHGFIKGKSTTTNLLEFLHYCLPLIESGMQVDCIFTDFSKAFDRINHGILIHKLSLLGFPPLFVGWLSSYLSGRTQRVSFRGALSDGISASSGVPQGSILGPLLFIIYINDVSMLLTGSRILCYADDAKIFRVVSRDDDCALLNSDLSIFHDWCSSNYLPLNASKCTTMTFTRRKCPILFDYSVDGCILVRLDRVKDLGVVLNSRLSFEDHIDFVVGRANSALGFVKRWSRELDDPYLTRLLFCTFVRPILEYASPVWDPYFAVHINRIEAVQRRFLRFALRGLPWRDPLLLPSYPARLGLISLDSLEKRRRVSKIVFMYDLLQGTINSSELLNDVSISIPARSLRNHDFLHVPYHRTLYGMHEPIASMSRLFNDHAACIELGFSRQQLKNQLRLHI